MSSFNATISDDRVVMNLKNLKHFAKTDPKKRLLDVGHELMRLSQEQVPHDIGTLQNSGDVVPQGNDVLVGYHTPYAHRLHEHPEYHFQKGRKGKYLTDPLNKNLPVFRAYMDHSLDEDVKRVIK